MERDVGRRHPGDSHTFLHFERARKGRNQGTSTVESGRGKSGYHSGSRCRCIRCMSTFFVLYTILLFFFKYVLHVYISVSRYNYDTFEAVIDRLCLPSWLQKREQNAKRGIELKEETPWETYRITEGFSLSRFNRYERIRTYIREDWNNTAGREETAV